MTKEEQRAYNRRMMRAWRARKYQDQAWLAEHRKKERARVKAYYDAHPDKRREQWRKFTEKSGVKRRVTERVRHAIKAVTKHGAYKPQFNRRKPDWVPVGQSGIDYSSPFLWNNLTDAQRAYASELAIERRAAISQTSFM